MRHALTTKQPWASLIVAGIKDVENRTWRPPRTLPAWMLCETCGARDRLPYQPSWSRCDPPGIDHGWRRADGPFPFRLWVHAGATPASWKAAGHGYVALHKVDPDAFQAYWKGARGLRADLCGVLLGSVLVTGCHWSDDDLDDDGVPSWRRTLCSPWAEPNAYHWTLADPQPLAEPIPMKGRQGLWTLPDDVAVPA